MKDIYKATDIVQITYQKLIEYLEFHTLDEIDNPKSFLVTISRRTALNEVKSYSNSKVIYTDKMETYYESTNEEPLTNIIKLEEAEAENDLLIEKYKDIEFPDNIDDWFEQELMSRSKINKRKSLYKKAIRLSKTDCLFCSDTIIIRSYLNYHSGCF